MIFPKYIKPGDTIAVTAPSRPMHSEDDIKRFMHGKEQLEARGYKVYFTENVFAEPDAFGRSSSAQIKAQQFNACIKDPQVGAVYSACGGDFLAEMLPFVDIEAFRENPKWFQGYSDNTSLCYYLATKADVAAAYGANFSDFGMDPWQECVSRGLGVLEGRVKVQESFAFYQDGLFGSDEIYCGYNRDKCVEWRNVLGQKYGQIKMTGRLLGGCLDVLMNLSGTPYDGTLEFIEKYKDDGIIWFLESFDLHFEQMMESLWKMKEMGWFEHTNGIIFGRQLFYPETAYDGTLLPSYEDVIKERLAPLDIPVIMDADIGHKGPQFVMIEGALAKVESAGGKGRIEYTGMAD